MEAWERKTNDERTSDGLHTFIIFCEGDVNEPWYFRYFETSKIKINPIGNQKSKTWNIRKTVEHCLKEKLMVYDGDRLRIDDDSLHIWCVYDRDINDFTKEIQISIDVDFDLSIQNAQANNLNVAWSNDSFELWILLHFEDVDPADEAYQVRSKYYERLTQVMKGLHTQNSDLQKILTVNDFNYKDHMKGRNNFINIVRKEMLPRTEIAINRSETLLQHFAAHQVPAHKMAPCSKVHKLVIELLQYGGKILPA